MTALGLVLALAVGGCSTTKTASPATKPKTEAAASAPAKPTDPAQLQALIKDDPIAAAAYWGSVYDSNPKDANAAANYGDALRQIGSTDQALTVLQQAADLYPRDAKILASYGKTLGAAGRPEDAGAILDRAVAADPGNAQTQSAAGVIQDQLGHSNDARAHYEAALKINPNDVAILNNYGLSCAFADDLPKAEELLRRAAASDQATTQIRQNLALVLSLAGKFDEARRIAGRDMLPKDAENNIAYVRDLLGQPARVNDAGAPDGARRPMRASEATGAPAP
jgi:Flp pilus assembly protein TadD